MSVAIDENCTLCLPVGQQKLEVENKESLLIVRENKTVFIQLFISLEQYFISFICKDFWPFLVIRVISLTMLVTIIKMTHLKNFNNLHLFKAN